MPKKESIEISLLCPEIVFDIAVKMNFLVLGSRRTSLKCGHSSSLLDVDNLACLSFVASLLNALTGSCLS